MKITSLKYIDAAQTLCEAVIDGRTYQQVGPGGEIGEAIAAHIVAGNKPAAYVAPAKPAARTSAQKVAAMLDQHGLTLADLRAELGIGAK
jgi:hypothetical protein